MNKIMNSGYLTIIGVNRASVTDVMIEGNPHKYHTLYCTQYEDGTASVKPSKDSDNRVGYMEFIDKLLLENQQVKEFRIYEGKLNGISDLNNSQEIRPRIYDILSTNNQQEIFNTVPDFEKFFYDLDKIIKELPYPVLDTSAKELLKLHRKYTETAHPDKVPNNAGYLSIIGTCNGNLTAFVDYNDVYTLCSVVKYTTHNDNSITVNANGDDMPYMDYMRNLSMKNPDFITFNVFLGKYKCNSDDIYKDIQDWTSSHEEVKTDLNALYKAESSLILLTSQHEYTDFEQFRRVMLCARYPVLDLSVQSVVREYQAILRRYISYFRKVYNTNLIRLDADLRAYTTKEF